MRKLFLVTLLALLTVSLSTVQASISGTPTLARHYDLRPLTNLSFYRSNGQLGDLNNDGLLDYLVYSNSDKMAAFADNGSGGLNIYSYATGYTIGSYATYPAHAEQDFLRDAHFQIVGVQPGGQLPVGL